MNTKKVKEHELTLDREVAARIRAQRLACGMTQTELGMRVGVTFQQVQKYENGSNRLTAGKLLLLSEIFGVPVEQFLVGVSSGQPRHSLPLNFAGEQRGGPGARHREVLELMRSFAHIEDERTRKHVLSLIKHLGGNASGGVEGLDAAA